MADSKTVGKDFLAGVLAKISNPDLRAQAEAAFNAAEAEAAVAEIGAGVLRQQDYSRSQDALRAEQARLEAWHGDLTNWFAENQERLRATPTPTPSPTPGPTPAPSPTPSPTPVGVTREDLQREFDTFGAAALGVMAVSNLLTASHMKQFGEVLDIAPLLQHPKVKELGLRGVYEEVYRDQLKARADAAEAQRVQQIKDEAIAEFRSKNPQLPYVVRQAPQASTLDALETPAADRSQYSVDAAVLEYEKLVTQKLQPTGA